MYYPELDEYFQETEPFKSQGLTFSNHLVPEFRVNSDHQKRAVLTLKASSEYIVKESKEIGFELLGFDFMVDESLNTYLIEVNTNPCLSTLSEPQSVLINKLLADTFK